MAKAPEELREVLTVTELTRRVKELLEGSFPFVWVKGEVSDLRSPSSGHSYFVLKDEGARLRSVLFRNQARYLDFDLTDGLEVVARGMLTVYEPRGEHQLVLDHLEPKGLGLISISLERVKARLAEEGLFDPERKRELPRYPKRVVVVTSPVGAARDDFIQTAHSRHPGLEIYIWPARVQGEGAAWELAEGVRAAPHAAGADVTVVTRGGGSFEDLVPFNQEVLVRAIAESEVPVVSAVGHEIDTTLADLAADYRAPTPTAAAVAITEGYYGLAVRLPGLAEDLQSAARAYLSEGRAELASLGARLKDPTRNLMDLRLRAFWLSDGLREGLSARLRQGFHRAALLKERFEAASPAAGLASVKGSVEGLTLRACSAARNMLQAKRARAKELAAHLSGLSPLNILSRGYSISVRLPERVILKAANQVAEGDSVEIALARGRLRCRVTGVER